MSERDVLLPLFPATGVLVPRGSIQLAATEASYAQLLGDCARDSEPFGVVYFDEHGLADVGCAARVEAIEEHDGVLLCLALGLARFEVKSTVSFEGDRQRVRSGDRELVFTQDESYSVPYVFVQGHLIEDEPTPARDDLRESVRNALLAAADDETRDRIEDAFEDGPGAELSFWLLESLVPDNTEEGNQVRLSFMRKRSENKRLRMLHDYLPSA